VCAGGYLWINGGWSQEQVDTLEKLFLEELGYTSVYSHKRPVAKPGNTKFDTIPVRTPLAYTSDHVHGELFTHAP